ncbi:MAG: hypothetical protein DRQ54_07165 [Gammaproteobacteria bacterium]|nr:MAG: hypothetical protein DRQ54_07165 [Gammaproteobacteria bacterium]RLA10574.1 MAG: hypothetical protein DRQ52_11165 [Gammaproteobacteria bacterium]
MSNQVDFGPLAELIGVWKGDKGTDLAPEPDGAEVNPYSETITYAAVGDVTNAESQVLAVVRYHLEVMHKENNSKIHDETGYWIWDAKTETVINSLIIPRAVCVLAGGKFDSKVDENGQLTLDVEATIDHSDWNIIQSPFMKEKARTNSFNRTITVGNGKMKYFQSTKLSIYGKEFDHTDENELFRQ